MVAPHCHTTSESKAAIKSIEHNAGEGSSGAPTGISGGSAKNLTTHTEGVDDGGEKGKDWVSSQGLKGSTPTK